MVGEALDGRDLPPGMPMPPEMLNQPAQPAVRVPPGAVDAVVGADMNRSRWPGSRAIAVTGEPGEATPPETWNQPPQPLATFHQVDMIRPSEAVVNRSIWSGWRGPR